MAATIVPTNNLTSQTLGTLTLAGAEISAYHAGTRRVFTTSDIGLQIVDLSDPSNPSCSPPSTSPSATT